MCRSIKTLFNFDPPATDEEIHAASLQFVRKLSGFTKPSKVNEEAFTIAVQEVAKITRNLINNLVINSHPRNRAFELERAREKALKRFGKRV